MSTEDDDTIIDKRPAWLGTESVLTVVRKNPDGSLTILGESPVKRDSGAAVGYLLIALGVGVIVCGVLAWWLT